MAAKITDFLLNHLGAGRIFQKQGFKLRRVARNLAVFNRDGSPVARTRR